jgi:hypothetical protein
MEGWCWRRGEQGMLRIAALWSIACTAVVLDRRRMSVNGEGGGGRKLALLDDVVEKNGRRGDYLVEELILL